MDHLLTTIEYLINDFKARPKNGSVLLTYPPNISTVDWKFSLNYINKTIKEKTGGSVDFLCYINLDPKKLRDPKIRKKAEQHLNSSLRELELFKKALRIKNEYWEFDDNLGGLVNRDNPKERIIFKKQKNPYYVVKELWSNKNNYASTADIARKILSKYDFSINKEEVRRIIPDIKKTFNNARVKKGYNFPYDTDRPSTRNAGVGIFRIK